MTVIQTTEIVLDNETEKEAISQFLQSPDYEMIGNSKTSCVFRCQKVFSNAKICDQGQI